jgi:hypothetical protein
LPQSTEKLASVLEECDCFVQKLLALLEGGGLNNELAGVVSSSEDVQFEKLFGRFIELLKASDKGPEIGAAMAEISKLMAPYDIALMHGVPVAGPSFVASLDPRGEIDPLLWKVRELLKDKPVVAYRANLSWMAFDVAFAGLLVVAPTADQYDVLRVEETNGANYELGTEDVIERLKELDTKFGVDVIGADFAVVEFMLGRIPEGQEAIKLGEWLLDFCPDLGEAPTEFNKGRVALWWD